ncbi:RNA-binding protein [Archaeoglobus neptunius]|uniref:RNA-binding protein n=1 Tax=Archaeoglobus neptunius TaxID=2798580 RepID=UPI0019265E93|nr:RNA-binding protein [Archaeoglobus neptunius]
MDTANDYRILLAEKGVEELLRVSQSLQVQGRKKFIEAVKSMASEVQNVKYCYLSPPEIAELENFQNLVNTAESLRGMLPDDREYSTITADYWLEYIKNLPELMQRGEISRAYEAIRYFAGEITSRTDLDSLWLCIFDCGVRLEVVTNSDEYRQGRKAVVAYLPPRKFGKVVSRGMFVLQHDRIAKKGELTIDDIRSIAKMLGEVEALLINLLEK